MASLIIQSTTRAVLDCDLFVSTLLQIKALASLSELVKQKQGKELLPIIPQWTFEYKKLILDYSRDVRRATHDVMTNVVTGAGFDSQFSNACPFSCRDAVPHLLLLLLVSFTWIYVVFLCHE
jgi:hypothetical protein